jgi:Sec7-like guanine-nucleotide exchange factor
MTTGLASSLGITVSVNDYFAIAQGNTSIYDQVKAKLALLAPNFTPPASAGGWNQTKLDALNAALTTQKTALTGSAKNVAIKSQLDGFFGTLKAAAPDFYSSHIADTNGGPPYKMQGSMTNADFGNLKSAFGTWLQSNSTDNQVAQQRLESLNNTRQAVLDGMSAFTQGQSQVTDRIGGNL